MIVTRTVEKVEVDWDHEGAIYITQDSSAKDDSDVVRIFPEHVDRMIEALKAAKAGALLEQQKAEDEGSNA